MWSFNFWAGARDVVHKFYPKRSKKLKGGAESGRGMFSTRKIKTIKDTLSHLIDQFSHFLHLYYQNQC